MKGRSRRRTSVLGRSSTIGLDPKQKSMTDGYQKEGRPQDAQL